MPILCEEYINIGVANARAIPDFQMPRMVYSFATHGIGHSVLEGDKDEIDAILPSERFGEKSSNEEDYP